MGRTSIWRKPDNGAGGGIANFEMTDLPWMVRLYRVTSCMIISICIVSVAVGVSETRMQFA